jgi:peptidyl-prolyl cis-trans isomerase A (cyclophilin A)
MRVPLIVIVSGLAAFAQTPPPAKTPAKTPSATRPNPLMNPAALNAKAPDLFRVKFETTKGDFVVEVHRDWAPLGADRFYNLVKNKFFTDNAFYRYSPGFIVQFGVAANPAVGKVWQNAKIKDDPVKESNKLGTLTFAMGGPGTRSTDFFINLKDNAPLDTMAGTAFAPIGKVTEGMDIVTGLYSGYGEMAEMNNPKGPSQSRLMAEGNAYLTKNFPLLDKIKTATVIFPEAPAPATAAPKKATTPATTAPKSVTPATPKKQ